MLTQIQTLIQEQILIQRQSQGLLRRQILGRMQNLARDLSRRRTLTQTQIQKLPEASSKQAIRQP
jgi:predicted transcriptional regulator